jgi:hypothetical protein
LLRSNKILKEQIFGSRNGDEDLGRPGRPPGAGRTSYPAFCSYQRTKIIEHTRIKIQNTDKKKNQAAVLPAVAPRSTEHRKASLHLPHLLLVAVVEEG